MLYRLVIVFSAFVCVSTLPTGRIVGGDNATVGQFPHQVALLKRGKHICGGSILNEHYILTAAHCVVSRYGITPEPVGIFQVRLGSLYRNSSGELYDLNSIIVNEYYGNFLNDVALLETAKPINFTENIGKIELAHGEVPSGENVTISGWGRTNTLGRPSDHLKWNTLKALSSQECQEVSKWGYDNIICLAHDRGNGACHGDSGGPATYNNTLVGVAGFVINGCGSNYPDGYAKVFYHRQWIEDHMIL